MTSHPPPQARRALAAAFAFVVGALTAKAQTISPATVQQTPNQARVASLVLSASQFAKEGATVEAEGLLQQALTLDAASIPANNAYGDLLLQRQRLPEAMEKFEAALAVDPRDPAARTGERKTAVILALHARAAGSNDAALLCLQHARNALPDDPEILLDLGVQAMNMHRLTLAAAALHTGVALDLQNLKLLYALARVETDQEHFADAQAHYTAYLQQNPNDASAHYGLGRVYQMQQQTDQAIAEFSRSIVLQPAQAESYFQLGQMQLDAHRDAEARTNFTKALASTPNHGGALTGLGILRYRSKDYDGASDLLAKAVATSPDYQPAHYYLGLALRRIGKQQEAEKELETAAWLSASQQAKSQPVQSP